MTTKLITGTCLQLLRRYDKKSESYRAQLLDDVTLDCPPSFISFRAESDFYVQFETM